MYRKYGMSRCHGWQGATQVPEVWYAARSQGRRCGDACKYGMSRCHGWQGAARVHGWMIAIVVMYKAVDVY